MPDLLRIKDLVVEFRQPHMSVKALDGASFRVRAGSTVALVGESGSGKSTVTQAIMGLLPKTAAIPSGEILFTDPATPDTTIDLAKLPRDGKKMRSLRGGRMSMIFQEPMTSLSPLHTIGDQIGEAVMLHQNLNRKATEELVRDTLALVGFPDPQKALNTYPFELSGGLRQRAMIAMALVCRPGLLIADEPTTALDVTIQAQILKLIRDLQQELKMAVLLITHDLGVVANMAEEVVVLYNGRVMEAAMLEDLYQDPRHPYTQSLLSAVPTFEIKDGERLRPIRDIEAGQANLLSVKTGPERPSGKLLEVNNLLKSFAIRKSAKAEIKQHIAVNDVSFSIDRGECVGLVGESGCGKTTLSKLIMGALKPDAGKVQFHGADASVDMCTMSDKELVPYRKRVQFVFQDPFSSLNPRMTVNELLIEPLLLHKVGDGAYRKELARELMRLVGLDPRFLNRYPHSFSGGQRQRIGIARSLALKPEVLILDEPTSALDVSVQAQILNLLKDLQQELGLTYMFISHNLAVVNYISDRIMVMCAGRIVESATRSQLFKNPMHPYTRALLTAVPFADLDHRLDFSKIVEGKASDPSRWPAPFTIDDGHEPPLVEVEPGHWIRTGAVQQELAS